MTSLPDLLGLLASLVILIGGLFAIVKSLAKPCISICLDPPGGEQTSKMKVDSGEVEFAVRFTPHLFAHKIEKQSFEFRGEEIRIEPTSPYISERSGERDYIIGEAGNLQFKEHWTLAVERPPFREFWNRELFDYVKGESLITGLTANIPEGEHTLLATVTTERKVAKKELIIIGQSAEEDSI